MPSDNQHLNQARHNIEFLESFYTSHKFNDWAITVAFYTAVHLIEFAIFKSSEIKYKGKKITMLHSDELPIAAGEAHIERPENFSTETLSKHTIRNVITKENFPAIADGFMLLYRQSRSARYRRYNFSDLEVGLTVKPSLDGITKWINKDFGTDLKLSLK